MNGYHLCVATAKLKFSDVYWTPQHSCYAFDITFEKASTNILPNLIGNLAGSESQDVSEDFLKYVKQCFRAARVNEGSTVSILFTGNQILAIGAHERDLWIDVRNGITSCSYPKSFPVLGIEIKSLEVY